MSDTIIHQNPQISSILKFGYLKSYLERNLLKRIGSLMLINSNIMSWPYLS